MASRGRRARHPARERPAARSGCTRARSSSSTPSRAASSTTRRSRASWRRSSRTGSWLRRAPDRHRRSAGRAAPAGARSRRPCCGASRRSATRRRTCGSCSRRWRRTARRPIGSMGTDTRAGGAVGQAAAAVRLLQAAVRAGHQPAARRDPRGAGHVDGLDHRPGGQPARAASRSRAGRSSSSTRSSTTSRSPSCATCTPRLARSSSTTLPMLFDPRREGRRPGARAGDGRAVPPRQRGGRGRLQHPDPVGPRRRRRARAPIPSLLATAGVHHHLVREGTRTQVRAGRRGGRRARGAPLRAAASATAPARSTRTSRSRPSTT